MIECDLETVARVAHGVVLPASTGGGGAATRFHGVGTDTRGMLEGRLFIAIRGSRHDGHTHLSAALAGGVAAALVDESARSAGTLDGIDLPFVVVEDTVEAMTRLARHHRGSLAGPVVGVTGSAGKTTTRSILESVLAPLGGGTASIKSFNNHIGVPLTLLEASPADAWVVLEMGTSGPGEIAHLVDVARPDVAVITGTGRSHLEALVDEAGVAREKASILDGADFAVVNVDRDAILPELDRRRNGTLHIVTTGHHPRADRRILGRTPGGEGGQRVDFDGWSAHLSLEGGHNAANALAAVEVARHLGVPDPAIARGLAAVEPPPMRMTRRRCGMVEVLDDAYNANPESMTASLEAFVEIAGSRRRILVLGDMLELGADRVAIHQETGRQVAGVGASHLVVVGTLGREIARGAREAGGSAILHEAADAAEAAGVVAGIVEDADVVMVKASRGMGLERVVEMLVNRSEDPA